MKQKAQITCTVISLSIILKSFILTVNYIDAIALIGSILVYSMYEFITDSLVKKEIESIREEYKVRFEKLEKDLSSTKDYMSKVSTNIAFRK